MPETIKIVHEHSFPSTPARLELEDVTLGYDKVDILSHLSVQIPHGNLVAVVGPNGAGKSTLFKALVGLMPVRSGKIFIHGQPLSTHTDCVAYIPQREEVDWRFPVTVEDVVMMGRFGRQGWLRRPSAEDQRIVKQSMEQMGIISFSKRAIHELSGGQQQRVFLARALAQEPHILLMDEPFNGVDYSTQEATLNLMDDLHRRGVTLLVSTHDLSLAAERFEQILLLNRKLIAFGKPAEVFSSEHLRQAFSGQVLLINNAMVIDQCCPGDDHVHEEVHHA